MPTERPDLPSLDDALALPDNATFPITETPPPGYMTDENEPVSPSSSAGNYLFLVITDSRMIYNNLGLYCAFITLIMMLQECILRGNL